MNRTHLIGAVLVCILVVSIAAFVSLPLILPPPDDTTTSTDSEDYTPLEPPEGLSYNGVDISFLKIMGFRLVYEDVVVYIDPAYFYVDRNDTFLVKADFILISHDHPTHCSPTVVERLSDNDTVVIAAPGPAEVVDADIVVTPGDVLNFDKVSFEFIPSYCYQAVLLNTNTPMHERSENNTGVIIDFEGTRIYHAGDTDRIPEMQSIVTDIAILPTSTTPNHAWMNASEAAKAVEDIKINSDLKYAIPTHWDIGPGWLSDRRYYAEEFAELANCTVVILDSLY
ncbi:MAG: MBL fold metallo-hydrolase [Candidatus Thorarchaeota archaeon]